MSRPRYALLALVLALVIVALGAAALFVRAETAAAPGDAKRDHRFQVAKRVEPARSPPRAARPRRPASLAAPRRGPGARARAARRRDWAALRRPGARSRALGLAHAGRLVNGVRLPAGGSAFVTWDPVRKRSPNRPWRRHGTDRLVLVLVRVLRAYRAAHPGAPRVAVGDLSRPRGGDFGRRFGPVGHASHQSGLDADVYYPRRDGRERAPRNVSQVDRRLAQALVDSFVEAGAERVFVGPRVGLRGPRGVVQVVPNHDDHLHVRLPPRS